MLVNGYLYLSSIKNDKSEFGYFVEYPRISPSFQIFSCIIAVRNPLFDGYSYVYAGIFEKFHCFDWKSICLSISDFTKRLDMNAIYRYFGYITYPFTNTSSVNLFHIIYNSFEVFLQKIFEQKSSNKTNKRGVSTHLTRL